MCKKVEKGINLLSRDMEAIIKTKSIPERRKTNKKGPTIVPGYHLENFQAARQEGKPTLTSVVSLSWGESWEVREAKVAGVHRAQEQRGTQDYFTSPRPEWATSHYTSHQIKHLRKITPRPGGLLWPHLTTFKSDSHKDQIVSQ